MLRSDCSSAVYKGRFLDVNHKRPIRVTIKDRDGTELDSILVHRKFWRAIQTVSLERLNSM